VPKNLILSPNKFLIREFLRFAQDDASGDLPLGMTEKGHYFADSSHKLRALAQDSASGQGTPKSH
jgi:hypothetical protein